MNLSLKNRIARYVLPLMFLSVAARIFLYTVLEAADAGTVASENRQRNQPRVVVFASDAEGHIQEYNNASRTVTAMSMDTLEDDDDELPGHRAIPRYEEGCQFRHTWQNESYPMGNLIHAIDMVSGFQIGDVHYLGKGARRIAWRVLDGTGIPIVLKALRYSVRCEDKLYVIKKEAQVADRMTASSHAVKMYGHSGCSGLHEFAHGPLQKSFDRSIDKLRAAYQIADAISELHGIEEDGIPSIAYAHLQPNNIMIVNGTSKLSDFEMATFLMWNEKEQRTCGFRRRSGSENRAPEEGGLAYKSNYPYKYITEQSDVYRLGNVFYWLLTTHRPPVDKCDMKEAAIRKHSKEHGPVGEVLIRAFQLSNACNPAARETSKTISNFLKEHIEKLEKRDAGPKS